MNDDRMGHQVVTQGGNDRFVALSKARELWPDSKHQDQVELFKQLSADDAEQFFLELETNQRSALIVALPAHEQRALLTLLEPDDLADLVQLVPPDLRSHLLQRLGKTQRAEVDALLSYKEDVAGGLMNPRYAQLRADMTAGEALSYLKQQARLRQGDIYYTYVLDGQQRLLGVVSLRELLAVPASQKVREFMNADVVTVQEQMDQEEVTSLFRQYGYLALPVVDADGRIKGIVTIDDALDVVHEETIEDAQKMGAVGSLEGDRYLQVGIWQMLRKRGVWLALLFLGEMVTASVMSYYEDAIAKAVVLALFLPLIISSGGNSGSQASTLVVQAMALRELRLRDWWRVLKRELVIGLALGVILATLGTVRILVWHWAGMQDYGAHYVQIASAVGLSLIAIVAWGSLAGSLLPFLLKTLRLDPATASTPSVATIVDITGVMIYFSVAGLVLRGTLL